MFARRLPIYVYGSAQAGPSDPTHVRPSIFILWFDALGVVCVGRGGRLPCEGRRLHSFRGQAPRLSPRHYYTVHLVVGQHRRLIRTCLVAHWITVLVRNMQEWWNQRTVRVLTVWLTYFRGSWRLWMRTFQFNTEDSARRVSIRYTLFDNIPRAFFFLGIINCNHNGMPTRTEWISV